MPIASLLGLGDRISASIGRAANMKGNTDVLEGKVASMLLVAYADGDCSDAEENEAITTLQTDKMLEAAGFGTNEIVTAWSKFRDKRPGSFTGKLALRREIAEAVGRAGKLTGGETIGEDIFLGAVNVAFASGDADAKEKTELKEIAKACGLSDSKVKELVGDALA